MIVRKIQKEDTKQFIELNKKLAQETQFLLPTIDECLTNEEKQLKKIEGMLEKEMQMVFVAEDEDKLIGFIGATRFPMSKVKHIAKFAIGVLDDYKGKGVALELLNKIEGFLAPLGISRIEFTVMSDNPRAVAFYEKHGYVKEGLKEKAIFKNGEFVSEFYMAKLI